MGFVFKGNFVGRVHSQRIKTFAEEGKVQLNEKQFELDFPTGSFNHKPYRDDPLECWEIPFQSDGEMVHAHLKYPFCDVMIMTAKGDSGLIWSAEVLNKSGESCYTWPKLNMWELETKLAMFFFFDPDIHTSNWIKRHEDNFQNYTWWSVQDHRSAGWYFALISRNRGYRDKLGFLPPKEFWDIQFMAFFYRYIIDFHKRDNKEYDIDLLLEWEEDD